VSDDLEVDVDLLEERLFESRAAIGPRYLTEDPADTPRAFADQLVTSLRRPSGGDPLGQSWTPGQVFRAAVRALGSLQSDWSAYLGIEPELQQVLLDFEPRRVADGLAAEPPTLSLGQIENVLRGPHRRSTATRIAAWAQRLTDEPDFYSAIQQLGTAIAGSLGAEDRREVLPPLVLVLAGYLTGYGGRQLRAAGAPARHPQRWKLPGMDPALVSQFLTSLGWDGYTPDRHTTRLLDRWLGDRLERFAPRAAELVAVLGTERRDAVEIVRYSLAGLAITPDGESAGRIGTLVRLIGAEVETDDGPPTAGYLRARR
jgi:hypothetical protein